MYKYVNKGAVFMDYKNIVEIAKEYSTTYLKEILENSADYEPDVLEIYRKELQTRATTDIDGFVSEVLAESKKKERGTRRGYLEMIGVLFVIAATHIFIPNLSALLSFLLLMVSFFIGYLVLRKIFNVTHDKLPATIMILGHIFWVASGLIIAIIVGGLLSWNVTLIISIILFIIQLLTLYIWIKNNSKIAVSVLIASQIIFLVSSEIINVLRTGEITIFGLVHVVLRLVSIFLLCRFLVEGKHISKDV